MIICTSSSHRAKHTLSIFNFFDHVQFLKKPVDFESVMIITLMHLEWDAMYINFEGQGSKVKLSAKPKGQGHRQYKDRHRGKESTATTFRGLFL